MGRWEKENVRRVTAVLAALVVVLALVVTAPADASTFTVTNTNDAGPGSLRAAIAGANLAPGADVINFNIVLSVTTVAPPPSGALFVIDVLTPLPAITDPVTIDGSTQPGFVAGGRPVIQVQGQSGDPAFDGLVVQAAGAGSTIRSLSLVAFEDAVVLNGASSVTVSDNLVGLLPSGLAAPNVNGVVLAAGAGGNTVIGNTVSGNSGSGVLVDQSSGNRIVGNRIGTDRAGTAARPNGSAGVTVLGPGAGANIIGEVGAGNVISGNAGPGVGTQNASAGPRSANSITGNLIGTDASGTAGLGNGGIGVSVTQSAEVVAGNVISGNAGGGLHADLFGLAGFVVRGNRIGTNAAGTAVIPNGVNGISLSGGSDHVVGGAVAGQGNLVSGNVRGIDIDNAARVRIEGNLIGTDVTGAGALGNVDSGIQVTGAVDYVIGGVGPGSGNTIAFNGGAGVAVNGGNGDAVRANSIHDNGGLGIDLFAGGLGVTPNDPGDPDEGSNRLQNFPVLTSAVTGTVTNAVAGTLQSLPSTSFAVDLFSNAACDPSGNGEGQTYLATVTVTTDAAGGAGFTASVPAAGGPVITATATDPAGNTSEFSACVALAPAPGISVADVSAGEGSGVATVTVSIPAPTPQDVSVTLTTADGTATAPADYTATSTTVVIPAGRVSATVAVPLVNDALDEADETFTVTLSNPTGGVLGVAQRTVTIVDDDPLPALRISDATVVEGNAGTSALTFVVSLSAVSGRPVSVNGSTSDGTATAGVDYAGVVATLTIPAGATAVALTVPVVGDTVPEPDETLFVTLSAPVNAVIADGAAVGVIATDDAGAGPTTTLPPPVIQPSTTSTVPPATPSSSTTSTTRPETRIVTVVDPTTTTTTTTTPAIIVTTTATTRPVVTTAPSTLAVPPTTTSSSTTPTSSTSTSTSTSAPAPATPATSTTVNPTTSTAPAPATRSTLTATAPDGSGSGRPGVGLDVTGTGYRDCDTVYFFFDGVRVGSDRPDRTGAVAARGLSVPGDAATGERRVTSSCRPAGDPLRAATPFVVVPADVYRPAFLTAIPQPRHVSTDAPDIALSGIVAAGLLILLAFPSQLFNATFTENYDEIRGWFRLPKRVFDAVGKGHQSVAFAAFALVGGLIYSLLSPDFGLNQASLALLAGMTVAVAVVTIGFAIPSAVYMRKNYGEWGKIAVLPGSLVVGLVCVTLSRLLHFQPGYVYGVLAALVFAHALREKEQGRTSAITAAFMLAVSVGAWALRVPVSAAAAEPGADVWLVALESCLGAIFLLGLESVVVGLLPMRFLDGARVKDWSGVAWAVLFATGLFALVHVLLSPGSGYVGHTSGQVTIAVLVLYVTFGAISVAFWAYFRYRPERWIPKRAR